jgi:cation transport ATPase
MRRTLLSLLVVLSAIPLPAAGVVPPDRVYDAVFDSLTCALCRKQIKETLMTLPKVKAVDFDLKAYKCYVTMDGGATLTAKQVDDAFKPTKYIFRSITECRTPPKLPASAPESKPAPRR